jgi:hypothetical protein
MGLAFYYCEPPEYHRLHVSHELAVKLVEAQQGGETARATWPFFLFAVEAKPAWQRCWALLGTGGG